MRVIVASALLCLALVCSLLTGYKPAMADNTGSVSGVVVDAATGLPLKDALVEAVGATSGHAQTDVAGRFTISGLGAGRYHLRITLAGYQTTVSDAFNVAAATQSVVTLSILRQEVGGQTVRTLGRTTIRAAQTLQRSAVIARQQSVESIERQGIYRTGDFLRTLPQVNPSAATGGSDTPSPGDDLYFDIRGIGGLDTVALMDGHPIGFGINRGKNLGYNWEVSPTFALRNVDVTYGSGVTGFTPYTAIGGVIDMQTLEPTPANEANFTQGWGTFNKLVTTVNATGTFDRLGYAFALGTMGLDGPFKNDYFFQPAAAFDPSAPAGTLAHDSGIYKDDTSVVNRGDFLKLRYATGNMDNPGHVTLSATNAYYWDDKTGNGDQDFLPFNTALAIGKASAASSGSCSPGEFTPANANGSPWGTGPNGQPDGGKSCVTPQQFASIASGLQGAGPTFQTFTIADYHMRYDQPLGKTTFVVDTYTNRFFQLYDRTAQEPFHMQPGDNPFWLIPQVNTTGESISDLLSGLNNDIGLGFSTNNYAYYFQQNLVQQPSPIVHDNSAYVEDVFHPSSARYKLYFNGAIVGSTITHTTVFNPRLSYVQDLTSNDVLRVAAGEATVQPYATYIDLPYSPIAQGALNGNLNCTGLTTIGQVSDPSLRPERGNDQELSLGHRFGSDSTIQATLYSENVNEKIYSTIIPAAPLAGSVIPISTFDSFETAINSSCGKPPGTNTGVGVNSNANVGRLLAQGLDVTGRTRVTPKLFFDYDYSIETSALESADVVTLQNNPVLIVGSQLPGVPMHKELVAIDGVFGKNIDARLAQHFVSVNNSKNSPAYNYGDFTLNVPYKDNTLNFAITNIFNQDIQYEGLIGNGVPLALNKYASASSYTPLIGGAATELYGIPYRQLFVAYSYHFH